MAPQGEDMTDHFLRILTDLAVTHCLTGDNSATTPRPGLLYFIAVDAYVRLLIMLITGQSLFLSHGLVACWIQQACAVQCFDIFAHQLTPCVTQACTERQLLC